MHPVFVDIFEPEEIAGLLSRAVNVVRLNNEPLAFADYWWHNFDREIMLERKQASEVLGAIGGKLDVQLGKYTKGHPDAHIGVIQEGIITPTKTHKCQVWGWRWYYPGKQAKHKRKLVLAPTRQHKIPYTAYRSYIVARLMEGFSWTITTGHNDTAETIASMVSNTTKDVHRGLSTYSGEKRDRDPYVAVMKGIEGIGTKTAEDLIERYGTPWDIFRLSRSAIGHLETTHLAETIFNAIGKE